MNDGPKSRELDDERIMQKNYAKALQQKARKPITGDGPRNTKWTGSNSQQKRPMPQGDLIGRVALVKPHPWLDGNADFYIGEKHAVIDGMEVCSWAARIASTFFRGSNQHELCDEVAVIRAFEYQGSQISDFHDDIVRDDAPAEPFRKRVLHIAKPPPKPGVRRPKPPARPAATPPPAPATTPDTATGTQPPPRRPATDGAPEIRAEALLRAQLQAPRRERLAPVLATLQPDQYELVTVPAMESTIIEGKPGTGKTIIAAHRAAYIVDEHTPPENSLDGKVLLVGPTKDYSDHVRDVVRRLAGDTPKIKVLSVPELWERIRGSKIELHGVASRCWMDADWNPGMLARAAIQQLRSERTTPTIEAIYARLRSNGTTRKPITTNEEWAKYLQKLPEFAKARELRAHAPLFALMQWEIDKPRDLAGIEHIIVDEAQDVTPIEWFLLQAMNEAHSWTLIGDLNQRRSDHTPGNWKDILEVLAIPYGDPRITQLKRGYRSTKPTLEFANRLLPRAERAHYAFQEDGPEPTVLKVRPQEIGSTIATEVDRLLAAHPRGTLAVIGPDPKTARTKLRASGWSEVPGSKHRSTRNGREITIVHPDRARGLEFDAVIVVEPADFPQNFGRHGPLYTSLTRANRELAVVHSKPLPEQLKKR